LLFSLLFIYLFYFYLYANHTSLYFFGNVRDCYYMSLFYHFMFNILLPLIGVQHRSDRIHDAAAILLLSNCNTTVYLNCKIFFHWLL